MKNYKYSILLIDYRWFYCSNVLDYHKGKKLEASEIIVTPESGKGLGAIL
jgi:hypothetical protein